MVTITAVIGMIQVALNVIGTFKGSPEVVKAAGVVQDAVSVVNALTPLVVQYTEGKDVTMDDVKVALADDHAALKAFDDQLAQAAAAQKPAAPGS